MTRVTWLLISLAVFTLPPLATAYRDERSPTGVVIQRDQERLTVKARDIPHRHILERLAQQLGFDLTIVGALETRRSLEIEGQPWEEALKRALSPASWAFVYEPAAGRHRLVRVLVVSPDAVKEAAQRRAPAMATTPEPLPAAPRPPAESDETQTFEVAQPAQESGEAEEVKEDTQEAGAADDEAAGSNELEAAEATQQRPQ
jgi:hypothetical protein